VTDTPIYVAAGVLKQAEATSADRTELIEEANAAVDDARVIADEAMARHAASMPRLANPND
jgi:hypothetical protein